MASPSGTQQNATIRALSTPEIISYILDAVCLNPTDRYPTLFACSLINSSWVMETRRRLWEYCGVDKYAEPGVVIPDLHQLLKVKASQRREFAKHVKFLYIANYDEEEYMAMVVPDLWEGPIAKLGSLSFPQLEEVRIEGPDVSLDERDPAIDLDWEEIQFHRIESVQLEHLIGPRLKRIMITSNNHHHEYVISEEWLASLAKHSRNLQYFYFVLREDAITDMLPESLELFLRSMESLKELRWDMRGSLSKAAFQILARMPSLQMLIIPGIESDWITDMHSTNPEDYFKSLHQLSCKISAQALTRLMPLLHQGQDLTFAIRSSQMEMDSTNQAFKTISYYTPPNLTRLVMEPLPGAIIHGEDILRLAKAAPNLDCFSLCLYTDGSTVTLKGVNDKFVESLAVLLPKLIIIHLESKQTRMTERSLVSFGKHCPFVRSCHLTAKLEFKNLLRLQRKRSVSWPSLRRLKITNYDWQSYGDESIMDEDVNEDNQEEFWQLCEATINSMPALETVEFQSMAATEVINEMLQVRFDGFENDEEEGDDDYDDDDNDDDDDDDYYE